MIITNKQYYIHILFETIAIIFVVPVLLIYTFNNWNKMHIFYKAFFTIFILFTFIVDGYLLINWYYKSNSNSNSNSTLNDKQKASILIRQAARYSHAARQDKDHLIALLHANYGSGYLYAAKDIFPESLIISLFPSYTHYKEFENKIKKIQDIVNTNSIKTCPEFIVQKDILTFMGGTSP